MTQEAITLRPPLRFRFKLGMTSPWLRAVLALAFVLGLGAVFNAGGSFFRWGTHRDMLRQIAVPGILACGMTLVIITAGIDLAVGSVLGLTSVLFSLLAIQKQLSPWLAIPLVLAAGTTLGATSGALVSRFRLQPFIATLAMMVFARGLAKTVSGGQKISRAIQAADGSYTTLDLPSVYDLIDRKILGENVAVVTLILAGCAVACWLILSRLRLGRYLYAAGGNEEAARLSGVPVGWIKVFAYSVSGLLAAVAGICQAVQEQQGDPEAGAGYELSAIAIVVIGGNSLLGGRGGIAFTMLGALTIGYLEKILSMNAVAEATRLMLTGLIIVAAVLLQRGKRI
jgi:ribose transport system permease protein